MVSSGVTVQDHRCLFCGTHQAEVDQAFGGSEFLSGFKYLRIVDPLQCRLDVQLCDPVCTGEGTETGVILHGGRSENVDVRPLNRERDFGLEEQWSRWSPERTFVRKPS